MDVNLEKEMADDAIVIAYLRDKDIATDFYRALCNMRWKKLVMANDVHEQTIAKLKGEEPGVWSCTWRGAGRIIAEIRNAHYNTKEDYMDFYCSGDESRVSDTVNECFERMGWIAYPWGDDGV